MNSREKILNKLRAAAAPFPQIPPAASYLPMTPLDQADQATLKARFIQEAEALSATVHQPEDDETAVELVLSIVGEDSQVIAWDLREQIPLPSLAAALEKQGIAIAAPDDPDVRVGISGAQAALAATGSLLVTSGPGRYRTASLLPPVHIAIITEDQILPHLESWVARQRADDLASFRRSSNIVVISGPSRTADIAMELILGMHGPRELHIVLLDGF